jgi:hypothetical protein
VTGGVRPGSLCRAGIDRREQLCKRAMMREAEGQ